jgi:hypothetical protein
MTGCRNPSTSWRTCPSVRPVPTVPPSNGLWWIGSQHSEQSAKGSQKYNFLVWPGWICNPAAGLQIRRERSYSFADPN